MNQNLQDHMHVKDKIKRGQTIYARNTIKIIADNSSRFMASHYRTLPRVLSFIIVNTGKRKSQGTLLADVSHHASVITEAAKDKSSFNELGILLGASNLPGAMMRKRGVYV
jgi:hypothetical protein